MTSQPLHLIDGHLFVELGENLWLLDTGAPTSFGESSDLTIAGEHFSVGASYVDLTAPKLSDFVGVACHGLLGADILGRFDHIFDIPGGRLDLSTSQLSLPGHSIELDEFMGIPVVSARIGDRDVRMFFDTGAQISYFQDESIGGYPAAGSLTDFFPGMGHFQTDTHEVPVLLGSVPFKLRCGKLPGLLGVTLMLAGTDGIVGNAIIRDRTVGYFPRRREMVL
jgi:hypothetical protein